MPGKNYINTLLFRCPAAVKRSLDPEDTEDSAAKHGKGFAFAQASTNYNKNITENLKPNLHIQTLQVGSGKESRAN